MKAIAIAILFIFVSPSYSAMYKWTDEKGNTHYGERPPNRQQAQNIAPPPPPASNPGSSNRDINALRTEILQQTEDSEKAKAEAKSQADEDKKNNLYCAQLRKRMETFQRRARIRQLDKDGNYIYLADEQKQQQEQVMQKKLVKDCS